MCAPGWSTWPISLDATCHVIQGLGTLSLPALAIGTSIITHCYYTTLPYHILEKGFLLSRARYAGIYRHAAGPCVL